jgi:hypothetical protein
MPSKLATATRKRNNELCEPSLRFSFNFENVRRGGVQPNGSGGPVSSLLTQIHKKYQY